MKQIEQGTVGSKISRRSVLKGALAAGVGAGLASSGLAMPALAAGKRTLKLTMPDNFMFGPAWAAKEAPKQDGTWKLAVYNRLQAWKEKYPDVDLQITEVPWASITQRVILDAQSGNQSDLVMVNDLNIPKLALGGFLVPLDDMDGKWDEYNQHLLRGIASSKGKIYAMPWTTDCRHEMYWKSDFEKAGIKAPADTWDAFTEQLVALKEAGIPNVYSFWSGNSVHTPTQTVFSQLWMLGSDVIDESGKATLNTPEMLKVFAFYNDLVNVKKVTRTDLVSISADDQYDALLLDHKTSVMKGGSWVWNKIQAAGIEDEIGYFRTPRPTADAKDATLSGFWACELPAKDNIDPDTQKLAFEFAMHIVDAEDQAKLIGDQQGQLPTRPKAVDSPEGKAKGPAWRFQAAYAGEAGRGMPPAADSGLLFDQIRIAFQQAITGAAKPEDALKAAETAYNSQQS